LNIIELKAVSKKRMPPKKVAKKPNNRPPSARKGRKKKGQEGEKPCWPQFEEHTRSQYIVERIIDRNLL
jgi:hypothetical protein